MIPYAADLRQALGLPVYSLYTLVQWLHAQGCPLSRDVAHRLYLETEELAFLANVA